MRRKLISVDALQKIEKGSFTNIVEELTGAESIVADVLGYNEVQLHCYDDSNVYYETDEGNFVHAVYNLEDNVIKLENIEEVVLDTESEEASRKNLIRGMLESVLKEDESRAKEYFRSYAESLMPKMRCGKGRKAKSAIAKRIANDKSNLTKNESSDADVAAYNPTVDRKKSLAAQEGHRKHPASYEKGKHHRLQTMRKRKSYYKSGARKAALVRAERLKQSGKRTRLQPFRSNSGVEKMKEWLTVANNVLTYVEHVTMLPSLAEVAVRYDDIGNPISAMIPTSKVRTEGKLLALKWDTLKTDVKVLREHALRLAYDESFQEMISQIKRYNNLSSDQDLKESLEQLVAQHPSVLYVTQAELAKVIGEALELRGASNYDDQTCNYIAEGILRTAFNSYPKRVNRLSSLANVEKASVEQDAFEAFEAGLEAFFPQVDEQTAVEMQTFKDLREIFAEVRQLAVESKFDELRQDATSYLNQIDSVLNGETKPSLDLAEEASAYLELVIETNLDSKPWDVVKTPYKTTVGEHPELLKKAQQSYSPSKDFSGIEGNPVSDGKSYKGKDAEELKGKGFSNAGGKNTYPDLQNPYAPKSGPWSMTADRGVDKDCDNSLGQWQSKDTWPNIDNPYIPKALKSHVSDPNKVDDVE